MGEVWGGCGVRVGCVCVMCVYVGGANEGGWMVHCGCILMHTSVYIHTS